MKAERLISLAAIGALATGLYIVASRKDSPQSTQSTPTAAPANPVPAGSPVLQVQPFIPPQPSVPTPDRLQVEGSGDRLLNGFGVAVVAICRTGNRGQDGTAEFTLGMQPSSGEAIPREYTGGDLYIRTNRDWPGGSFSLDGSLRFSATAFVHHSLLGREGAFVRVSGPRREEVTSGLFPVSTRAALPCGEASLMFVGEEVPSLVGANFFGGAQLLPAQTQQAFTL